METVPDRSASLASSLAVLMIDGPNAQLFETWLENGSLPNLRRMRDEGVSGSIMHTKEFRNERCWNHFLNGRKGDDTGSTFDPGNYRYSNNAPGFDGLIPFYASVPGLRTCVLDLVAPIAPDLNGMQVIGWGSELNAFETQSVPPDLIDELVALHGASPRSGASYEVDSDQNGIAKLGFRNPNIYSPDDLKLSTECLLLSIERRTAIALDLLERREWDLFLGCFPETHTANHLLWHVANVYPLRLQSEFDVDPLRQVFQAIDRSIGAIWDRMGPDSAILAMTIDETGPNRLDVPSMALLPELVWRAGKHGPAALYGERPTGTPEPRRTDYKGHWKDEVWALRTPFGEDKLLSPDELTAQGDALNWNPAQWFRGLWPQMSAFALPSISDGHIRINVTGREAHGVVQPQNFSSEIGRLCTVMAELVDPRSGEPAVERCLVMRSHPDEAAHVPPDIVVVWNHDRSMDCLEHPKLGRVGPVPYFRSGGHYPHGTTIRNRYYAASTRLTADKVSARDGQLVDMPRTILNILGVKATPPVAGQSLITAKA